MSARLPNPDFFDITFAVALVLGLVAGQIWS